MTPSNRGKINTPLLTLDEALYFSGVAAQVCSDGRVLLASNRWGRYEIGYLGKDRVFETESVEEFRHYLTQHFLDPHPAGWY